MKMFKISHNVSAVLKSGENESHRFFSNIEYANSVFEIILERINFSKDEWISLDEVIVEEDTFGEYFVLHDFILRYYSEDTKIGVRFNPNEYGETNQ